MKMMQGLVAVLLALPALDAAAQNEPVEAPPAETTAETAVIPVESIQPEASPAPPEGEGEPARLDDIVVTATKRASPVRKIPSTLTVLSGEDLEREGVQSIEQIVAKVPGVTLSDDGASEVKRITIRGIASTPATNFTAGTLYGDIPFSDPFAPKVQLDPNPFDMATVEILKGPQGTLFGGTGLNGMIRYVPEAPQFDGVHVKYYAQLNAYPGNGDSGWSYGAVLNTPFAGDAAALRIMGFHRDAPGYIDDTQHDKQDINHAEQYGFRAAVAWHPDENWKISLLGTTQHTVQDDVTFTSNFDGQLQRSNTPRPSPSTTDYSLANLSMERSFEWGDLVSQTSLTEKEYDNFVEGSSLVLGGRVPLLDSVTYNSSEGFSQELRLVSPDNGSPWKWLAGAFYYKLDLHDCTELGAGDIAVLPNLQIPPALRGLLAQPCTENAGKLAGQLDIAQIDADIDLTEHALFGEVTRELGEDWEVILGARAYRTQTAGAIGSAGALYAAQSYGQASVRDAAAGERGISPKASIVYEPLPDLRTYFTVSRGFRFGGPQLGSSTLNTPIQSSYKSDSLWNYELGLRSDWLDRTLRLDVSAYHIVWKDAQVHQRSSDNLVVFIDNVGGVEGNGVDLSLRYLLPFVEGVSLSTAVSWNRTVTTTPFKDSGGADVPAGSPWPAAPRWQTSTTLAYAIPLEAWRSSAALTHTYSGTACNAIACTNEVFGYRTLGLNFSLAALDHPMWPELSLSLDNLTDERGINHVNHSELAPGVTSDIVNYIPPRAVVLRLSGNF